MCSKMHALRGLGGMRHAEEIDMSAKSTATTSPGFISRRYLASTRSSAHVSDAKTKAPMMCWNQKGVRFGLQNRTNFKLASH